MPRTYTRKTNRGQTPPDLIKRGIKDVLNCGRSIRAVAQELNMQPMTLCRYIKRAKAEGDVNKLSFGYKSPLVVFDNDQELALVNYLKTAANIYFGLSPKDVRVLAYECASAFNVKMPVSWETNKCAGPDWFSSFLKRHDDLSIRTPEATSLSRATSFNRQNANNFFTKLATVIERENISGYDIWNVDETGLSTVQKPKGIVAPKGSKQVGSLTSGERGAHVTLCCAVSATGNTVPPLFVFPRVKYYDHFLRDGPEGAIGVSHPSGWMTSSNFLVFLEHFAKHVKSSPDKKVLLILDNHDSHISADAINFAREHGIVMLSFPPHCSHKLQPLDRSVFGPLKKYMSGAQDSWMRNNPGKTMSIYDLPGIVRQCWPRAASPENIMNGFKVAGVHPYNKEIFTDDDFAASFVTDRPLSSCGISDDQEEILLAYPVQVDGSVGDTTVTDEIPEANRAYLSEEWEPIYRYVQAMNREIVNVRGDGHCLLYAIIDSLKDEHNTEIDYDTLCDLLLHEVTEHETFYSDFTQENIDVVDGVRKYIFDKEYNTEAGDIIMSAVCNSLGISVIIYTHTEGNINVLAHPPNRQGTTFRGDLHLALSGTGAGAHYNWARKVPEPNCDISTLNHTEISPSFSPESICPHPKAPPRKQTNNKRRKRKTAILTDTPEKEELEKQEQEKRDKNKSSSKVKKSLMNNKKETVKKQQKKKKTDDDDTSEDEYYCLVCADTFSNSKSREKWIQCHVCKHWSHEDCADIPRSGLYICLNCDSDDELF